MGFRLSTGVVEHIPDLGCEVRDNGRVEERIETGKDNTADDNADDDFDAGVDVAFTGGGSEGGFCGDDRLVLYGSELGLDVGKKLFHTEIPLSFCVIFCFGFYVWMGSALVVEHLGDLRAERREDRGVEQDIETGENHAADDNTDDNLDTGVDVAFACLGGKGGLGGSADGIDLVTDGIEELFHVLCYLSFFEI